MSEDERESTAGPNSEIWGPLILGLLCLTSGVLINQSAESHGWRVVGLLALRIGTIVALIGAVGFGVVLGLQARDKAATES